MDALLGLGDHPRLHRLLPCSSWSQLVPHPPEACSVFPGRSRRPPPLGKLASTSSPCDLRHHWSSPWQPLWSYQLTPCPPWTCSASPTVSTPASAPSVSLDPRFYSCQRHLPLPGHHHVHFMHKACPWLRTPPPRLPPATGRLSSTPSQDGRSPRSSSGAGWGRG
jgi:hypothetical protein